MTLHVSTSLSLANSEKTSSSRNETMLFDPLNSNRYFRLLIFKLIRRDGWGLPGYASSSMDILYDITRNMKWGEGSIYGQIGSIRRPKWKTGKAPSTGSISKIPVSPR